MTADRWRKADLTRDEEDLVEQIGESYKAFRMGPVSPDTVPLEVAIRAAERAYRRGVTQGAYYMLWHLRGSAGYKPGELGEAYASQLFRWRERGGQQKYAKFDLPPEPPLRVRPSTSRGGR